MQIDFYCEYPKENNLEKLKLIKFPCRTFIASSSIKKFKGLEKQAKKINKRIACCYWPIVKNSYWISPFSNTRDLEELFKKLDKIKNQILIDLEPPFLNKKLIFKNILNLRKNKRLITSFLKKNKKKITTAEHPFPNSRIMQFFGLDYNINTEKDFMYYTTVIPKWIKNKIKRDLIKIKNKENCSIGLGVNATGVFWTEKILSPKKLEEDLNFVKQAGFDKVIIYRLGGLNKEYIKVIKKFR